MRRVVVVSVFAFVLSLTAHLLLSTPVALAGNPITFVANPDSVLSTAPSVHLVWRTGDEVQTAGYNLYRSDKPDGALQKVNTRLIPAVTDLIAGGQYAYEDGGVQLGKTYYYRLEVIDRRGNSQRYGPVAASVSPEKSAGGASLPAELGMGSVAILGAGLALLRHLVHI